MGRSRRKYGQPVPKQRPASAVKTESDEFSSVATVLVNEESNSNMMILDSRKEKVGKTQVSHQSKPRKLSKKQRKKLQKVVDQKEKKAKRAELLEELSKVQVNSSELAMMSSIAHLGTKNSNLQLAKRPLPEDLREEVEKLNSIRGSKRRKQNKKIEPKKEDSTDTSDISLSSDDEREVDQIQSESDTLGTSTKADNVESAEPENIDIEKEGDTTSKTESASVPKILKKKDNVVDKLAVPEKLQIPTFPTVYVPLERNPSVQESRLKLPILAEEQSIMEAIHHHHTVVLCGETGSGKTTQVPQFLYEAGYAKHGMIGVTEPRRVAAISMSRRVATEMNLSTDKVSYQIRYEGNVTPSTEVKFMTDGVLLREIQDDFLLSRYSAIIIDEAHERSVYTDVLIGLLSRIVPLRNKKVKPMRLIIMSATLRVEDFTQNTKLFKVPPPVLRVETRQFPVTVHFNKKTPVEGPTGGRPYVKEAFKKICKVHRTLPAGGILVFVTGQNEVHSLCKLLKTTFPSSINDSSKSIFKNIERKKESEKTESKEESEVANKDNVETPESKEKLPEVNLEKYSSLPEEKEEEEELDEQEDRDAPAGFSDDDDLESDDEIMDNPDFLEEVDQSLPLHVLPLYSLLATSRQQNVFKEPPENTRLCVVATNVAETSLTIPGIKYVIDTGKVKKRVYDKVTGISSFQITWVSKASADQRAGRAGRVGPGHAYRLYSSAVFQDFTDFSSPEIASRPVPGLVLQMKQMNIEKVINFPFPTPPSIESLQSAEDLLISLGAVEKTKQHLNVKGNRQARFGGPITLLGKSMAMFPVHPRFGKMLATASAKEHKELLPYVITLVAALTVREIFMESHEPPTSQEEKEKIRHAAVRLAHLKSVWSGGTNQSARAFGDLMVLLGAVGSAEYTGLTPQLCNQNCLRYKALLEIRKLRAQLTNVINSVDPDSQLFLNSKMEPPDDLQIKLLRQIVLSAMGDHVAKKIPESQIKNNKDPKEVRRLTGAYSCLLTTEPVFIHPTSVMSQSSKLPEYVVFQEIIETNKSYMKDVMVIEWDWLSVLNPQYCTFSAPMEEPCPYLNKETGKIECYVNANYGRLSWPLGTVTIIHPPGLERYKWFARYMLEEFITRGLPKQFSCLLSKPEIMTKSWANLQPRTQSLLKALLREEVDEKQKLISAWKKDKYYLLIEFQEWLPESIKDDLPSRWPPKL